MEGRMLGGGGKAIAKWEEAAAGGGLATVSPEESFTKRRQGLILGYEPEGDAVVAVAESGGLGAVAEDVTLVGATARTVVLGTGDDELEVALRRDAVVDRAKEARPSGAALELHAGVEEGQEARGAHERPRSLLLIQGAGARAFGGVLEENGESLR
jgi:hypothetical protein